MAMGAETTVESLSEWIGEPISEDEDIARANRVLAYAWTLVNSYTERDAAYWAQSPSGDVANVVLQVAGRGYLNPESWTAEHVDDWGASGRPVEEEGMYLTRSERQILSRFQPRKLTGLTVVDTYRDDPSSQVEWARADGGRPVFPW